MSDHDLYSDYDVCLLPLNCGNVSRLQSRKYIPPFSKRTHTVNWLRCKSTPT